MGFDCTSRGNLAVEAGTEPFPGSICRHLGDEAAGKQATADTTDDVLLPFEQSLPAGYVVLSW